MGKSIQPRMGLCGVDRIFGCWIVVAPSLIGQFGVVVVGNGNNRGLRAKIVNLNEVEQCGPCSNLIRTTSLFLAFKRMTVYLKKHPLLKWMIITTSVLMILIILFLALGVMVVNSTYSKCKKDILDNKSEAIGAVKKRIVWDTASGVDFIKVTEPVEFFPLGDDGLEIPPYWKVTVNVGPDEARPDVYRVYYVTTCAEVYGIEEWEDGR